VSEKDRAKAAVLRLKVGERPTRKTTAKLKLSSWYTVSAQSIGISKKDAIQRREEIE
jgi:hypothetical protein